MKALDRSLRVIPRRFLESCSVTRRYAFNDKIHRYSYCIVSIRAFTALSMNDESLIVSLVSCTLCSIMARISARVQESDCARWVLAGYWR